MRDSTESGIIMEQAETQQGLPVLPEVTKPKKRIESLAAEREKFFDSCVATSIGGYCVNI